MKKMNIRLPVAKHNFLRHNHPLLLLPVFYRLSRKPLQALVKYLGDGGIPQGRYLSNLAWVSSDLRRYLGGRP
jgi:hypothetical protein